ncbi:response regulator transcription factor [Nocardia sp. NBC_00881]|uniref:response regulator transcription factor n=1 Tax=Nocardia sp. NBC_00881 TaxID=2975995 RepID=UPI00386F0723|nr:response regulator transcription factor [Nocardia sp. NBC_00881]
MRLAVMESDGQSGQGLVDLLIARGYSAKRMSGAADLLVAHRGYDAVVLDLTQPDMDGLQVLRRIREASAVPVVAVGTRTDERYVVRILRGGADDYLVKPVRVGELIARLEKVVGRAVATVRPIGGVVVAGDVRIDLKARRVEVAGAHVPLTRKEFELITTLVERPGVTVSRQQLMDRVWGEAFFSVSKSLDVHMTSLRSKLNRPGLIVTIRGHGYRWVGEPG